MGDKLILDRTREAMKAKPKIDLQRQEIAAHAGVTPALITYYFPNKWDLFVAAAKPVVNTYISEIHSVLLSGAPPRSRLSSLINVILRFNFEQGHLLDFYIESSQKTDRGENLQKLGKAFEGIQDFFGELLRDGLVRGKDPTFIHSSLFGLCQYLAQEQHRSQCEVASEIDDRLCQIAANVCDLFLDGAGTHEAPPERVSAPSSEKRIDLDVSSLVFQSGGEGGNHPWTPHGHFSREVTRSMPV